VQLALRESHWLVDTTRIPSAFIVAGLAGVILERTVIRFL